ncbi:hypothetical protein BZG35_00135 [Brevundimonas sp. LM2]|uniref:type II toxin-antitoxin system RelE/ParE family toxin n=1 Tax=Brevundimonas sp. LM2 TaxID=1938605 RepID=UPI000983F618|nr:type II toxin-antitoxin system RelE/ParE family toxin [Brevundimonas sp. LM2]AQR60240.1 hypothetical protein BZG35_00135 [Brevundimonas sp. LM2]
MKARFSRRSEIDLAAIGEFIAGDNPRKALSFVRELRTRAAKAATDPRLYAVRGELTVPVRRIVHGNYCIYYSVRDDEVRIERIMHAAMSGHPVADES